MPVFALYNFDDAGTTVLDSAPGNGAQNGIYLNGAAAADGQAVLDGHNDMVKIYADPAFQLDRGTLEIRFTTGDGPVCGPQTVLSRDSTGETDGGYRIDLLPDGSILIVHETEGGAETFGTPAGFVSPGDEVHLTYSWDQGGSGGQLVIENLTSGETFDAPVPASLTMDQGAINQPWIIGAGQADSDAAALNNIDQHFEGTVEMFSISDSVDNLDCGRDGIVYGTSGDDLIDIAYTGDNDGDVIDGNDAILPGAAPNDDLVFAGDGNDTVFAGQGNDLVYGGSGDDLLSGGDGADILLGGDDRDTFVIGSQSEGIGDVIDGSEGGDDHDTLDLRGAGPLRINYDPANAENGTVNFFDGDGNVTGSLVFTNIENVIPCFTPGTLIATPRGEVPVESLKAGDRVITRDNGIQEIRWVGARPMTWRDLAVNPHLKPILVRQGSLGDGLPERDMMVSPNHRLLVANDRTALYFDEHEVLVAAKHLVAARGVHAVDSIGTTYLHFMFDRHEVVLSNGAWTESFQPGDYTLKGMGNAQRTEIYELFPDLKTVEGLEGYSAARRTLRKHEARLLAR